MEVLIGIQGPGYVIMASNLNQVRGITIMSPHDDKSRTLNSHNILLYSGEPGDTVHFAEYIQANISLYSRRNEELEMNTEAVGNYVRTELATSLRSKKPYQVNVLVGGFDHVDKEAKLFYIDYLGSKAKVPYAAQGYAGYYLLSLFDRHLSPTTTLERAMEVLELGFMELERRMPMSLGGFIVRIVDESGIKVEKVTGRFANKQVTKSEMLEQRTGAPIEQQQEVSSA